jgi:hypothetical protein
VYGIDFPDRTKLMAANNTVDEIRKYLNADSLHYLSQAGMVKATGQPKEAFCMACYDGKYPVPYDPVLDKHIIEAPQTPGANPRRSGGQLAAFIDHTLLKADATAKDIEKLCAEAREHKFFSVCVNGSRSPRRGIFWTART